MSGRLRKQFCKKCTRTVAILITVAMLCTFTGCSNLVLVNNASEVPLGKVR